MSDNNQKVEDWWTPYQVDLVEDKSRVWQRKVFKTTAGVWLSSETGRLLGKAQNEAEIPPDATFDANAWDHEHCQLCWEKISHQVDYQREGYTDGNDWLCIICYNTYVKPESPDKAKE